MSHGQNSAPLKIHETCSPTGTNIHKPIVYRISGLKFIIHHFTALLFFFFFFRSLVLVLLVLIS